MPDALAVVTRVISEHHAIKEHVRLARDTVNDIEALFTLQRAQSGWTQTSITALLERRDQLLQAISFLQQGLRNHSEHDEADLGRKYALRGFTQQAIGCITSVQTGQAIRRRATTIRPPI